MIFSLSIDGRRLGSLSRRVVIAVACSGLGLLTTCRDVPTAVVSGRVIWQLSGSSATVAPAYDQTVVYFGGYSHEMVAVDKSTGQRRWRSGTGVVSAGAFPFSLGFNIVLGCNLISRLTRADKREVLGSTPRRPIKKLRRNGEARFARRV